MFRYTLDYSPDYFPGINYILFLAVFLCLKVLVGVQTCAVKRTASCAMQLQMLASQIYTTVRYSFTSPGIPLRCFPWFSISCSTLHQAHTPTISVKQCCTTIDTWKPKFYVTTFHWREFECSLSSRTWLSFFRYSYVTPGQTRPRSILNRKYLSRTSTIDNIRISWISSEIGCESESASEAFRVHLSFRANLWSLLLFRGEHPIYVH